MKFIEIGDYSFRLVTAQREVERLSMAHCFNSYHSLYELYKQPSWAKQQIDRKWTKYLIDLGLYAPHYRGNCDTFTISVMFQNSPYRRFYIPDLIEHAVYIMTISKSGNYLSLFSE